MTRIISVALPVPLRKTFDYQIDHQPAIGSRVRVPFGGRELVGWVSANSVKSTIADNQLKSVVEQIDQHNLITEDLWELIVATAHYYHHSLGETLATALPNWLSSGKQPPKIAESYWRIIPNNTEWEKQIGPRAVRQVNAMRLLQDHPHGLIESTLTRNKIAKATLRRLADIGLIESFEREPLLVEQVSVERLIPTEEQQAALAQLPTSRRFRAILLEGVTGSGKTEVYLQYLQRQLQRDQQALILIPEIGLTPQTLARFEQRFPGQVASYHSGMTDRQRMEIWQKAQRGTIRLVIGTRSAVFVPFNNLSAIIVDEEHDASYKQQDGLRYSSRDVAMLRAQKSNVPIVLGSATPSLESIRNAESGRYQYLQLTKRATDISLPNIELIDSRQQPMREGLSHALLQRIETHLSAGQQALVFINRRGFAPVWLCHHCGWIAECKRCDSYATLHQTGQTDPSQPATQPTKGYLQCHHCGSYQKLMHQCPSCGHSEMRAIGTGTERIEQLLSSRFPNAKVQRIDRDTTRRKGAMSDYLAKVQSGDVDLLVGTQMLAKGHDFPNLTLVAIVDIDGALFSSDFRAIEKAAQQLTQVAGRAGRGQIRGNVVIQTHHPYHPFFRDFTEHTYQVLARHLLTEREQAKLPPTTFAAMLRAESLNADQADQLLQQLSQQISAQHFSVEQLGPLASPIRKRAGRFRFQLMLNAVDRPKLHQAVHFSANWLEQSKLANKVRWSIDIDPQDLI